MRIVSSICSLSQHLQNGKISEQKTIDHFVSATVETVEVFCQDTERDLF